MKIKRILCVLVLCAASSLALAQQGAKRPPLNPATLTEAQIANTQVPSALHRLAGIYQKGGDLERLSWTLKRLDALQPQSGNVKLSLATTYALMDKKSECYDLLMAMQKQGYGYDLSDNPNFSKVTGTGVWKYVVDGLKANLKPFGEGKVAYTLPAGDTLYESLAYDSVRKRMLVGSVRDGTIQIIGKDGKLESFITPDASNGLWSVYAMAADPEGDALYVASTASVYFKNFAKDDFGKAGIFKFKLSSGKLVEKYLLQPDPNPRTLSSIAVGKNGLVFAADGVRNVIYRLDGGALKVTVENPKLTSIRGLAINGDGSTLYFADYTMGVLGVDLSAGKGFDLRYDMASLVLGGIDGLFWYDGTLVAIQNQMSPHRVMRLTLGKDGRSIVKVMPLDVANPAFSLPTYGAIEGDGLYFVANSQKNRYGTYGTPKDGAELQPVKIFRSDLRFAWAEGGIPTVSADAAVEQPKVVSESKPGTGNFSNVEGGSQSVTGD